MSRLQALLFDCDGTLAETERDGHRVAYNEAFHHAGLPHAWSAEYYEEMLQVAGGRERLIYYFDRVGWPVAEADRGALLQSLHQEKTRRFLTIIGAGSLPPCEGVTQLIDAALAAEIPVAICSTSQVPSVEAIAVATLGPERAGRIRVFAGDMVDRKKPDPAVYLLAARAFKAQPAHCVTVEDSAIGLAASRAAGMPCIVTPSHYTLRDDFSGAALQVEDLTTVTLEECEALCADA